MFLPFFVIDGQKKLKTLCLCFQISECSEFFEDSDSEMKNLTEFYRTDPSKGQVVDAVFFIGPIPVKISGG